MDKKKKKVYQTFGRRGHGHSCVCDCEEIKREKPDLLFVCLFVFFDILNEASHPLRKRITKNFS